MAIQTKITDNSKEIAKKYSSFQKFLPKIIDRGILQGGFQLLDIIKTKTKKGKDINNNPFAPYSSSYRRQLELEGKPTSVDLFNTGRMLGSLTPGSAIKKTGFHKITLGFARSRERDKAFFNQVLGNPKRVFFGFNNATSVVITKQFSKYVESEIKKFKI